jgi:hypothetical protein
VVTLQTKRDVVRSEHSAFWYALIRFSAEENEQFRPNLENGLGAGFASAYQFKLEQIPVKGNGRVQMGNTECDVIVGGRHIRLSFVSEAISKKRFPKLSQYFKRSKLFGPTIPLKHQ